MPSSKITTRRREPRLLGSPNSTVLVINTPYDARTEPPQHAVTNQRQIPLLWIC
ncbi:hypothetical protein ACSS6W_010252 [Trichoderma asperelloides]